MARHRVTETPPLIPTAPFASGRYSLQEQLGEGGMGVVYRAHDRERDVYVALKTLRTVDPAAIYRLKREFRLMADVSHENLVQLYELGVSGQHWFFTMELIEGDTLRQYTGRDSREQIETATLRAKAVEVDPSDATMATETSDAAAATPRLLATAEVIDIVGQLVSGVHALHCAGYLHRDIKPSNVMITPSGRVVVLDFGILAEIVTRDGEAMERAGTAAYMAPEQAEAEPTPASDWYAVGSLLYEMLTGRRPFAGSASAILHAKTTRDPAPPSRWRRDIPPALEQLCMALLQREPEARPDFTDILARLGETVPPPAAALVRGPPSELTIGRDTELATLRQAFDAIRQGQAVTVHVRGSSGMGKSTLVRTFLDECAATPHSVVLTGRCYERENVPHKAVDSLVDSLSHYLMTLPQHQVEVLLPRDVVMLSKMFPVLRRVQGVDSAQRRAVATPDPLEFRRRAFAALRELLGRLAAERQVLLFIDDVHWGDVDSAPLLQGLMQEPDAPSLLLVYAYRTEEAVRSPLLQLLARIEVEAGHASDIRIIDVGPLSAAEARLLAEKLLGGERPESQLVERIVQESGGAPYFIHELARAGRQLGGEVPSLDELIRQRVSRLDPELRTLVQIVALAGKPMPYRVVSAAAGLTASAAQPLRQLTAAHLLWAAGTRSDDMVDTYHSRTRTAVAGAIAPEQRRRYHRQLAEQIRRQPHIDIEAMVEHLRGAGEDEEAAEFTLQAAEQAFSSLAFDRAAELFGAALSLAPHHPKGAEYRVRRAESLQNAGRAIEAGQAYLAAVDGVSTAEALELRRRAGTCFMFGGHIEDGLRTLYAVLEDLGLSPGNRGSLAKLLVRRAFLRLRGLRYRARDDSAIAPRDLARADACWSAAAGLSMVDTFHGIEFQTRNLLLALRCGDERRICLALATEAAFLAASGAHTRNRAIAARARTLAARLDEPFSRGWILAGDAVARYQEGQFHAANDAAERADRLLAEECTGVQWERASMHLIRAWALFYLGDLSQLTTWVDRLIGQARDRGDLYTTVNLRTGLPSTVALAADNPARARRGIEDSAAQWTSRGFHLQHYYQVLGHCWCDLYTGSPEKVLTRLEEAWPPLRRMQLLRVPSVAREARFVRACAVLASVPGDGGRRGRLLRHVEREARRLAGAREDVCARALGATLAALVSATRDPSAAPGPLQLAEEACERADMTLFELALRRHRGQLISGDAGASLVANSEAGMVDRGIANPSAWTAMLLGRAMPA